MPPLADTLPLRGGGRVGHCGAGMGGKKLLSFSIAIYILQYKDREKTITFSLYTSL